MTPYQSEQIEVIRRIAERGKGLVERRLEEFPQYATHHEDYLDLFVHLLDEIKRLKEPA